MLHKREIARLIGKVREKGYTLVPLKAYFKGRFLKIELGLCKGKHSYDKKQTIRERDLDRQAQRDIANYKGYNREGREPLRASVWVSRVRLFSFLMQGISRLTLEMTIVYATY